MMETGSIVLPVQISPKGWSMDSFEESAGHEGFCSATQSWHGLEFSATTPNQKWETECIAKSLLESLELAYFC
jgi:hypothetical protein